MNELLVKRYAHHNLPAPPPKAPKRRSLDISSRQLAGSGLRGQTNGSWRSRGSPAVAAEPVVLRSPARRRATTTSVVMYGRSADGRKQLNEYVKERRLGQASSLLIVSQ